MHPNHFIENSLFGYQYIGLYRREIHGPRVYLLIPYPPGGRGVSPRSHGDKENLTVIRAIIFLCFFKDFLRILYRFKGFTRVYRARNYQKTKGNHTKTQRKLKIFACGGLSVTKLF